MIHHTARRREKYALIFISEVVLYLLIKAANEIELFEQSSLQVADIVCDSQ